MTDTLIYPNGIDAVTGEPLLPAMPSLLVVQVIAVRPARTSTTTGHPLPAADGPVTGVRRL